MKSSSFVEFYSGSKGETIVRIPDTAQRLSRKTNVGINQQIGETSDVSATIEKEVTRTVAKEIRGFSIPVERKKIFTTNTRVFVSNKKLRSKENTERVECE